MSFENLSAGKIKARRISRQILLAVNTFRRQIFCIFIAFLHYALLIFCIFSQSAYKFLLCGC